MPLHLSLDQRGRRSELVSSAEHLHLLLSFFLRHNRRHRRAVELPRTSCQPLGGPPLVRPGLSPDLLKRHVSSSGRERRYSSMARVDQHVRCWKMVRLASQPRPGGPSPLSSTLAALAHSQAYPLSPSDRSLALANGPPPRPRLATAAVPSLSGLPGSLASTSFVQTVSQSTFCDHGTLDPLVKARLICAPAGAVARPRMSSARRPTSRLRRADLRFAQRSDEL